MESIVEKQKVLSVQNIAMVGVMTALMCVFGPLSVPIGPVPISLTNLVIYFAVIILGWKLGTISYLIYLFIGLVGVPVFSGFSGGAGKLFGPTGGYLIGFIPMAILVGIFVKKQKNAVIFYTIGMIVGTLVTYALGTAWLAYQLKLSFGAALQAGVIPFIPGDAIKIVVAALIAPLIRAQIRKAGFVK